MKPEPQDPCKGCGAMTPCWLLVAGECFECWEAWLNDEGQAPAQAHDLQACDCQACQDTRFEMERAARKAAFDLAESHWDS